MPSKSRAQSRLMRAAANTPGGVDGVSQAVGKEFSAADHGKRVRDLPDHVPDKKAHGGSVNEERRFASKTPPVPKKSSW